MSVVASELKIWDIQESDREGLWLLVGSSFDISRSGFRNRTVSLMIVVM